jgi:transposase
MASDAGWDGHLLDSSVFRAHADVAGARRTSGEPALGRSRGRFSTKLHDQATPTRWKPNAVSADKAYSAAWLLEPLRRKRIVPLIPNRADQPGNPDFGRTAYRWRNLVERLVGKPKPFRRVAPRYDKLETHYLASGMVWLRSFDDRI